MRGVKRCQESTGRMKKHRYSNELKVTAVKMANAPDFEMKAVAEQRAFGGSRRYHEG